MWWVFIGHDVWHVTKTYFSLKIKYVPFKGETTSPVFLQGSVQKQDWWFLFGRNILYMEQSFFSLDLTPNILPDPAEESWFWIQRTILYASGVKTMTNELTLSFFYSSLFQLLGWPEGEHRLWNPRPLRCDFWGLMCFRWPVFCH